jgi:type II secretory pathway pseudopilin PulG
MKQTTHQNGSALLFVLVAVTIMGLLVGIAGSTWKTITQRAKEEELLWRGNQFRKAIGTYYNAGPQVMFPQLLEQLNRDPRAVGTVRHLRRLYLDPITGDDWVLIKDSLGRIQGVRSSSPVEPFKKDNFSEENKDFAGKTAYADWRFVYTPKAKNQAQVPQVQVPTK